MNSIAHLVFGAGRITSWNWTGGKFFLLSRRNHLPKVDNPML